MSEQVSEESARTKRLEQENGDLRLAMLVLEARLFVLETWMSGELEQRAAHQRNLQRAREASR